MQSNLTMSSFLCAVMTKAKLEVRTVIQVLKKIKIKSSQLKKLQPQLRRLDHLRKKECLKNAAWTHGKRSPPSRKLRKPKNTISFQSK